MNTKKVYPPIATVLGFIESLNYDADFYTLPRRNLIVDCLDRKTGKHVCQIEFKHFDIVCEENKDISKLWLKYIFENNPTYFKEYCNYHTKKAASVVRGDYRFLEYLRQSGFIPSNEAKDEEKTID